MSKAKYLEIGQSLSRLCYIDKDDIRHMQRLAGYDTSGNDISVLLSDAQKTNRHLQAPAALLHALVDSSISKLLDAPTAGRHQRTILDDIGKLFLIERDIVAAFSGQPLERALEIRKAMRDAQSRPLVEPIGVKAMQVKALSESPLGRAVKYLVNQWDGLIRLRISAIVNT